MSRRHKSIPRKGHKGKGVFLCESWVIKFCLARETRWLGRPQAINKFQTFDDGNCTSESPKDKRDGFSEIPSLSHTGLFARSSELCSEGKEFAPKFFCDGRIPALCASPCSPDVLTSEHQCSWFLCLLLFLSPYKWDSSRDGDDSRTSRSI